MCGYEEDMKKLTQECEACQANKQNSLTLGLLQPLTVPNQVWSNIAMDFIEGLPLSKGYTTIMVVVDQFIKYGHFIALGHAFAA